jgi:hypothetical protein
VTDFQAVLPVPKGDPVGLEQAVNRLRSLAGDGGLAKLGKGFQAEGSQLAGNWKSPEAAAAAQAQVSRLASNSTDFADRIAIAAQALRDFAERLAAAQAGARTLQNQAARTEIMARDEASKRGDPQAFRQLFEPVLNQLIQQHRTMTGELDQAAKSCAMALENAIPGYQSWMKPDAAAKAATAAVAARPAPTHADKLIENGGRGSDGLQPPAAGNDPKLTAAWWQNLTVEEKAKLLAGAYRQLGNSGGIPAAVRSQANERALTEDLTSQDPAVRNNAVKTRAALDLARQQLDPNTHQPVTAHLLVWDPAAFGGDGRAAIGYGDIDTAHNVMVSVPGITSSVDTMDARVRDASNLYNEIRKAPGADSAAVVAWMGYNAPSGGSIVQETATSTDAIEGSHLLANDVTGFQAGRVDVPPPHLTVIGHSYGSVAVGMATSSAGLTANDIVLLGSPGPNVATANDLTAGGGHVWVGSNQYDPVSHLGYWVTDPASTSFGGTRFDVQGPNSDPVLHHTGYYDANSESLRNIARVGAGDYRSVTRIPGRWFP